MRRLAEHCHTPVHIYPLALLCYEIMPPPRQVIFFSLLKDNSVIVNLHFNFYILNFYFFQVEKQIGERRKISFNGVGLSAGPEMNFQQVTSHCKEIEEVRSGY